MSEWQVSTTRTNFISFLKVEALRFASGALPLFINRMIFKGPHPVLCDNCTLRYSSCLECTLFDRTGALFFGRWAVKLTGINVLALDMCTPFDSTGALFLAGGPSRLQVAVTLRFARLHATGTSIKGRSLRCSFLRLLISLMHPKFTLIPYSSFLLVARPSLFCSMYCFILEINEYLCSL